MKRLLIIGASGMLGGCLFRLFSAVSDFTTYGTVRSSDYKDFFPERLSSNLITGIDVRSTDCLHRVFEEVRPEIVINCAGVVKQLSSANDPLVALPLNSLFPHRLSKICSINRSRLIHVSTDCVFSGSRGMYLESDTPDASDLYGVSKRLGEISYPNCITLRTSIIGHELNGARGLIDWFLAQEKAITGYTKALFSGLPTIVLGNVIKDYVIPNSGLEGLYHVSAQPISKYELLSLVAEIYGKDIVIGKDYDIKIDRSLDSSRFRDATGFSPPDWRTLIQTMHDYRDTALRI